MSHVRYLDRIRDYYQSEGYDKPYVWANFDEVPFTPLAKPLAQSRLTVLTTSDVALRQNGAGGLTEAETTVGNVYALPFETPVERLYSRQESYDRYATDLDDIDAFLPLTRLREFAEQDRIGSLTANFFNINRGYSQRLMRETAAPLALERCREANAEVALLVPV